jgi:hypothetical protein
MTCTSNGHLMYHRRTSDVRRWYICCTTDGHPLHSSILSPYSYWLSYKKDRLRALSRGAAP